MLNRLPETLQGFGTMVKELAGVNKGALAIILLAVLIAFAEWKGTSVLCAIAGLNCPGQ